jgi:hypothetical protein
LLIASYWAAANDEVTGITENAIPDKSMISNGFFLHGRRSASLGSRQSASPLKARGP